MTDQTDQTEWKNRIVGHDIKPAAWFIANEDNWRIHPRTQQNGMSGTLKKIGWVQDVIVNKRSGEEWGANRNVETLVDGHLRVTLALKKGDATLVPVKYVDLSPEEEALVLATFDPLGALAATDKEKLDELLARAKKDSSKVNDLLATIAKENNLTKAHEEGGVAQSLEDVSDELEGVDSLRNNVIFQSDLPYGYPMLLKDMCFQFTPETKIGSWGGNDIDYSKYNPDYWLFQWGRESIFGVPLEKLIVGFYVDDFRFESFWNDCAKQCTKLINANVVAAVMPNFSMLMDDPDIVRMYSHYKSLWVARYMQEAGIMVIPDIQTSWENPEINWMGIPTEVPISIQSHHAITKENLSIFMKDIQFIRDTIDKLNPPAILYYADQKNWEMLHELGGDVCERMTWVRTRLSMRTTMIKGRNEAKKAEKVLEVI